MDEGWPGAGPVRGQVAHPQILDHISDLSQNQTHQTPHWAPVHRYIVSAEKYVHRLMIQTVRVSDSGEYSVVAGSSVSRAHLTVEGRDIRISEPPKREITVSVASFSCLLSPEERKKKKENQIMISVVSRLEIIERNQKNKTLSAGFGEASGNF